MKKISILFVTLLILIFALSFTAFADNGVTAHTDFKINEDGAGTVSTTFLFDMNNNAYSFSSQEQSAIKTYFNNNAYSDYFNMTLKKLDNQTFSIVYNFEFETIEELNDIIYDMNLVVIGEEIYPFSKIEENETSKTLFLDVYTIKNLEYTSHNFLRSIGFEFWNPEATYSVDFAGVKGNYTFADLDNQTFDNYVNLTLDKTITPTVEPTVAPAEPQTTETPVATATPAAKEQKDTKLDKTPKTGDKSNVIAIICIMSAAVIISGVSYKKIQKNSL